MNELQSRALLQRIARRVMQERGLLTDFPPPAVAEVDRISSPAASNGSARDLRPLLWASIDNDESKDLDQLTVAEERPNGAARVWVALADVDALVRPNGAVDGYARQNTTSVYTAAQIFPMLPEKLSTNLTSLAFDQDRLAVVVEMAVDAEGNLTDTAVYRAMVRNRAKLTYNDVAAWLDGIGPVPPEVDRAPGLAENLRLQDGVAQRMRAIRYAHGALTFETREARVVFGDGEIRDLAVEKKNRAKDLIEDLMIAANGATARFLADRDFPSIRRVVRTPKHWERIVELARQHGETLPEAPNAKALQEFLMRAKAADPVRFPDLSLAVIKLLGKGEYVAELPGEQPPGHFGLAVRDYTHATAPNRRYTDLVTQRLLKAALDAVPAPYRPEELSELARHCTDQEDAAGKVERQVNKSAAALVLRSKIGEQFGAIVTGAAPKGTWVRTLHPPVEGRLVQGFQNLAVGDRVQVQLIHTDVEQGYIDFKRVV